MKKYLIPTLIAILILSISGVWFYSSQKIKQPQKYTGSVEKITIGVLKVAEANTLFLIAQEKNFG